MRIKEITDITNASTEPDEHNEIRITPEMIDIGADVILGVVGGADLGGYFSAHELAEKVYRAMTTHQPPLKRTHKTNAKRARN